MRANSAPISVADYCNRLNTETILVNEEYQRSDNIWVSRARSYFIESILLEFPIPKIYLHVRVDLRTRESVKEIVDGQQRSRALQAFFNNRLRLSSLIETEDLKGKRYRDLDDIWKARFLSYSLPVDEFIGVSEDDIQEAFRRMNANNVPLNDEEQRNAKYQGEFKWWLIEFAKTYRERFGRIKVFSRRDIIRMVDLRTFARISCVLDKGFSTLKGAQLDALYRRHNSEFSEDNEIRTYLPSAVEQFLALDVLHRKPFTSFHTFESAVLALAFHLGAVSLGQSAAATAPEISERVRETNFELADLIASIEDPDNFPELAPYVIASSKGTNVAAACATRFLYLSKALNEFL